MSNRTAIIGAMDCEVNKLRELLINPVTVEHGKLKITTGKIEDKDVIIAQSGVGKVNAALNTQYIIDKFNPQYIINTGVAGGIGNGLSVGDIVIGKELVQYDFDTSALGYAKGYMCTGIDKDKPTKYFSDDYLIKSFKTAVSEAHTKTNVHEGIIATGDTFVSDKNKKTEIRETFNAIAVEMEGCAIAQVANANNIPCIIIRALSDLADGSATKSLEVFETEMAEFSASAIKTLLKHLREV